jgi:hypothetical protein
MPDVIFFQRSGILVLIIGALYSLLEFRIFEIRFCYSAYNAYGIAEEGVAQKVQLMDKV